MTDIQIKGVAAGFVHALQASPELFNEWMAIPKDDVNQIGALIQRTMCLQQAPSRDDLEAMAKYVDSDLQQQTTALQAAQPMSPRHVGFIMLMQQNS